MGYIITLLSVNIVPRWDIYVRSQARVLGTIFTDISAMTL